MRFIHQYAVVLAWIQSLVAVLGSVYYSEVQHLLPCRLCWYQRILMFPLTLVLFVGLWRKDKNVIFYALPLSIIGMFIAIYHYAVQQFGATLILPCALDNPCGSTQGVNYFGFITIPFLSFIAFFTITALLVLCYRTHSRNK